MSTSSPTDSATKTHAQPIAIDTSGRSGGAVPNGRSRSSSLFSNPPNLSPSSSPLSSTMSGLQTPSSLTSNSSGAFPRPGAQPPSPSSTTSPLAYFLPSSPIKKPSAFPWTSPPSKTTALPATSPTAGGLSRILSNPTPGSTALPNTNTANNSSSAFYNNNDSALAEDDDPSPLMRTATNTGATGQGKNGGGHFRSGSLNLGWSHPAGRERAAGVMRRLSLSSALVGKPNVSPPSGRVPSPPMPTPVSGNSNPSSHFGSTTAGAPQSTSAPYSNSSTPTPAKQRGRARGMSDSVKKRGVSPMGERMLKGHFDGFGL